MKRNRKEKSKEAAERTLVGMDVHSEQATLCVTCWRFGEEPRVERESVVRLDGLEAFYRRHVPEGALTVMEATGNAFAVAGRLAAEGFEAKVVCSDTLAGFTRGDKVNDRHDAHNLARAWARGSAREVRVPEGREAAMRELHFGRRDATKDSTVAYNRIWAFCHRLGLVQPGESAAAWTRKVAAQVAERYEAGSEEAFRWRILMEDWTRCEKLDKLYNERVEAAVASHPDAARLMQVLGIGPQVALALCAFIGEVKRFAESGKLVAYVGLNPSVCQSGKSQGSCAMSHYGRRDLKWLLIQAAQSAMVHGKAPMHQWARRKRAQGKSHNLVVCALARKMLVQVWHILMGHPPLDPAISANHRAKLTRVARSAKRTGTLETLGFNTVKQYVLDIGAKTSYPARVRGGLIWGEHSQSAPLETRSSTRKTRKK